MIECFLAIKSKIQLLVATLNLVSYLITTILTSEKKPGYIEYTSLSKYCPIIYSFVILILLFLHSLYNKLLCSIIKDNLSIFVNDQGKIILNLSIGVLYWSCDNTAQLVFVLINFVSSFALFLCEFIFNCDTLKYNTLESKSYNSNDMINQNDV